MSSMRSFETFQLRDAFDFAIMVEEDAQSRYEELARILEPTAAGTAAVFRAMALTEAGHCRVLVERRDALFSQEPSRIPISVLDPGIERAEFAEDELPRTPVAALEMGVAAEQRAYRFYGDVIPHAREPAVRAFFEQLQQEEACHAALLAEKAVELANTSERDSGGPPPPAPSPAPAKAAEPLPDRAGLASVIGRFDAATQAVAFAVILGGKDAKEIAAELGVSRRTVARKLSGFLQTARQLLAGTLVVSALAGFAPISNGSMPAAAFDSSFDRAASADGPNDIADATPLDADEWLAPGACEPCPVPTGVPIREIRREAPKRGGLAAGIRGHVERRMSARPPELRAKVAEVILSESNRVGIDPLLVLAVIQVESEFNPEAVSSCGAKGLMQLMESTMREVRTRAGLPEADPHDPVANLQAGTRYLRQLLSAFGGDVEVALIAYNAGPNRVRELLRQGDIPEKFQAYPRRVKGELARLRAALAVAVPTSPAGPTPAGPVSELPESRG